MPVVRLDAAYSSQMGWIRPAIIDADKDGKIRSLSSDTSTQIELEIQGVLVPAAVNAHSHAFQHLMSGLCETFLGLNNDQPSQSSKNFWTWRQSMYAVLQKLSPSDLYLVAKSAYALMRRNGYSKVVEFQYIFNDSQGKPYADHLAPHKALVDAAQDAKIDICLIPVYYNQANFGQDIQPEQRRFYLKNTDQYEGVIESLRSTYKDRDNVSIGTGIHSLRAIRQEEAVSWFANKPLGCPFHIHIAEQQKEIDDCMASWGARPVQWLADHLDLTRDVNLVHATHLNSDEFNILAKSNAQVVLCPSTEANLGDGFFPFQEYSQANAQWSIGSDSHIGLEPLEELRWLDYQGRLKTETRSEPSPDESYKEKGDYLYLQSIKGGLSSFGDHKRSFLNPGDYLDGIVLDTEHPNLFAKPLDKIFSSLVFSCNSSAIKGSFYRGRFQHSYDNSNVLSDLESKRYRELIRSI